MLPFLLVVPVFCAVLFFIFAKTVCWKEFLATLLAVLLVNAAGVGLSYMGLTRDVELLNGSVSNKKQVRVSCEHSYDCNCHDVCSRDSKGNESCHEECDTCYEHSHDYDWDVFTDVGTVTIDRIDRQGTDEPPRWTAVKIGEPVARPHGFTNYIKAAPNSILRTQGNKAAFTGLLPAYPKVYDYYRVKRVVPVGVSIPNYDSLNLALCDKAGVLGPSKQANVVMVVVKSPDQAYTHALEEHWLGGKKNDVIIVVGVPDGRDKIEWASVISWSEVELLKVKIRDEIVALGSVSKLEPWVNDRLVALMGTHFKRKPMADFAYLRYQYSPSPTAMFLLLFLGLAICIGLSIWFIHADPFDSGFRSTRFRSVYNRRRRY